MPTGSILVADDDAAIRTVLNQALSRAGYEVRSCGNAATLWRWISQGEGELVITDVVLPDENVFDLLPRIKKARPDLTVDGEMQADLAVVPEMLAADYPWANVHSPNVLIFPDLQSANAAYKLVWRLAGAEAIGPILLGMRSPVHVLQRGEDVADIVNMAAIAVVDAQEKARAVLERG